VSLYVIVKIRVLSVALRNYPTLHLFILWWNWSLFWHLYFLTKNSTRSVFHSFLQLQKKVLIIFWHLYFRKFFKLI